MSLRALLVLSRLLLAVVVAGAGLAPPARAQRQMENLGRGVIAMRTSSTQAHVSWRLLGGDDPAVAFNLYRAIGGAAAVKLNATPLTTTTDYRDTPGSAAFASGISYFVRPVLGGVEQPTSAAWTLPPGVATRQYFTLPLQPIPGATAAYDVKFCWVGDLDGDGEYDFVVDRLSTASTAQVQYLEAYRRDGTFLWRASMGANSLNQYTIEPGSSAISVGHSDNVTVYDLDGDGRAEVLLRTANGVTVANAAGAPVAAITAATDTAQFISVLDGLSGVELARAPVPNPYLAAGPITGHMAIAYLDGTRPSLVWGASNRNDDESFNHLVTAWDFRAGSLTQRWSWRRDQQDADTFHQIRIADVDNDGRDEYLDGSFALDDDGTLLFTTELIHGDRFHVTDIDPDRPGLETFAIQQDNATLLATALYRAHSGEMIKKWYAPGVVDVGRGIALDMDPAHYGLEMYSTQPGTYNAKGDLIYANNLWAPEGLWWDGDLSREFIDGAGSGALSPAINKFVVNNGAAATTRLYSLYNENGGSHQAYGGRPAFWGDIFGDWREELIVVANDFSELRIYTTTSAASTRLYTLMHNPAYRMQATTKGYVQASYPDYYLGTGMTPPPPPPVPTTQLTWVGGPGAAATWDAGTTAAWRASDFSVAPAPTTFAPGAAVLFDTSGSPGAVTLATALAPGAVRVYSPHGHRFTGPGALTGAMPLTKQGAGVLTLAAGATHSYTGATTVWDGALLVDGTLSASPVTVWGGVWGGPAARGRTGGRIGGTGTIAAPVTLQARGALTPGAGMGSAGTLTLAGGLTTHAGATLAFDLGADSAAARDQLVIQGALTLAGPTTIHVQRLADALAPGSYPLLTYTGALTGSLADLTLTGLEGLPVTFALSGGALTLTVPVTRAPAGVTWVGASQNLSTWNNLTAAAWRLPGGAISGFVPGDAVSFDDTGSTSGTITLAEPLAPASVSVSSSGNLTLSGAGYLLGAGGLTKAGPGTLTLTTANTFTGPVAVSGGVLAVPALADGGYPSPLGASSSAAANLTLSGGATLRLTGGTSANSDRGLTLGAGGGTLEVATAGTMLQLGGAITGAGRLTKSGAGTVLLSRANPYAGGTTITGGKLQLASFAANQSGLGSGAVTLQGGTLAMVDIQSNNYAAWPLVVPAGSAGRLDADGRCTLAGSLTGGGDFTFYTPFIRTGLAGNWSAFTGRIFALTDADGGDFRVANTAGYAAAALDLGAGMNLLYISSMGGNLTLDLGALSGAATATVRGGPTSGRTLTWRIGARGGDTTFAGSVLNGTGPTGLTKIGAGTLTLSGALTHTGATTVAAGTLLVDGTSAASAFTVQSGGTLGGTGTITGNVSFQSGATLRRGATPLTIAGTASFAGTIQLTSATPLGTGTYTLVQATAISGSPTWVYTGALAGGATATIAATGTTVQVTISEPTRLPGALRWSGATSGAWDTTTSNNWRLLPALTAAKFIPGDTVTFDDTLTANPTVTLNAALTPAAVTFAAATTAYTLAASNGGLSGAATLTKSGAAPLTLTGGNSHTGGTTLHTGTLMLGDETANVSALAAGPVTLLGGTLQQFDGASSYSGAGYALIVPAGATSTLRTDSRIDFSGTLTGSGALTLYVPWVRFKVLGDWSAFAGTLDVTTDADGGLFRLAHTAGLPAARVVLASKVTLLSFLNQTHTIPVGALASSAADAALRGIVPDNNTPQAHTITWEIGARGTSDTFAGTISNGTAPSLTAVRKVGAGTWTLTGAATHAGATTVAGGTLALAGTLTNSATVEVLPGATLNVTGALTTGTLTIRAGGRLTGTGAIHATVVNEGLIETTGAGAALAFTGALTNTATGTMRFTAGASFTHTGGTFTNHGTLDVITAAAGTPAPTAGSGAILDATSVALPTFEFVPAAPGGPALPTLTLPTLPGHTYTLLRATELGGTWSTTGVALAGDGTVRTFTDPLPPPGAGRLFYRIVVNP